MDNASATNVRWWDERADLHGQDSYYDTAGFLHGQTSLIQREIDEVAAAVDSVEGLDLLHLQCHFGLDTMSWARLGAHVTGVDFSPRAIAKAKSLSAQAGIAANFVEADVLNLPADLDHRFDVVFASDGVFCWVADLEGWMNSAFRALRKNGHLIALDAHPLLRMLDSVHPLVVGASYQGGVAEPYEAVGSYARPDASTVANQTVQYHHGLGEVVNAATAAGFRIESLREWLDDPRGEVDRRLERASDGSFRLRIGGRDLPCYFSIRASKP